jgi:hypothetical protein
LSSSAKLDKVASANVTEHKCTIEVSTACVNSTNDNMRVLKQYRRARGLCDRCAKKWVYGHKCVANVQLQAIQEFWDLLSNDEAELETSAPTSPVSADSALCLILSETTLLGLESAKSMKLCGFIRGKQLVILLDSESSHTFLDAALADQLQGLSLLLKPLSV